MTSRTIDVFCSTCSKYLFSLQPNCSLEELSKKYYCEEHEMTIPDFQSVDVKIHYKRGKPEIDSHLYNLIENACNETGTLIVKHINEHNLKYETFDETNFRVMIETIKEIKSLGIKDVDIKTEIFKNLNNYLNDSFTVGFIVDIPEFEIKNFEQRSYTERFNDAFGDLND